MAKPKKLTQYQKSQKRRSLENAIGILPKDYPNYEVECCNCSGTPTVGSTELCGPCCFGSAETIDGNW